MYLIEFRPNDLASPHIARLTDDPPPKDLELACRALERGSKHISILKD
jgi:hypothetical protein